MSYSWHPTRDGYGTVLGPHNGDGYPYVAQGVTLDAAREQFGDVADMSPIPVTVEVRFIVQRLCAKNDVNGSPRRVFVIRNGEGDVVAALDEGFQSGRVVCDWLMRVAGLPFWATRSWRDAPGVVDIGDVDVAPGVYRRFLRQ